MLKISTGRKKIIATLLVLVCFFSTNTVGVYAQAQYSGVTVSNGNLKGDLARCQKASISTQNWLKIGTGIIQGTVATAGSNNFRANIAAGNQVGQQIVGQGIRELSNLACGKKCKERLRNRAGEGVANLVGKQAAGSIMGQSVPVDSDKLKAAIETGNEERKQDDANHAAALENREVCVDALATFGIQNALMALQARTFDFINTGNGGAPFYLQDPESYFNTLYKDILKKNINTNPKNETEKKINDAIIYQVTGKEPSAINQGFSYLRDSKGVKTNNWNSFLNSSFSEGAMGQYLSKVDNLNREYAQNKEFADQEILRNNGFLDQKVCTKYGAPDPATQEKPCLAYKTVTPGSVLADQVSNALGSRFQSLAQADGISDSIALGFTSFVDSFLQRGLSNIGQNDRTYEYALGGANSGAQINKKQFSSQYLNTFIGRNGRDSIENVTQDANGVPLDTDFNIAHTTTLAAVLRAQNTFLNVSKDSINANRKLVAELGALDYCVPGPNPAWLSYAYQNQNTYASAVQGGEGYQAFISPNNPQNFKNETFTTDRFGFDDPITDSVVPYKSKIFKINPPHAPIKNSEKRGSGNGIIDFACGIGSGIINIFGGDTSCERTETWTEPDPTASNVVADAFTQWFAQYSQDMLDAYSTSKLTTAFTIADTNRALQDKTNPQTSQFIKARVRAMLQKTNALVDYNQQLTENIDDYDESIDKAIEVQAKMQDIYTRSLAIVKVARARHIATQRAQGVIVNEQCLDKKYSITENTAGRPQSETDADADATVIAGQFARENFYDNLCKNIPGTSIPECTAPLIQSGTQYPFIAEIQNLPECSSDSLASDFTTAVGRNGTIQVAIKSLGKIPANYTVRISRRVFGDVYASEQNRQIDGDVPLPGLDLRYTMAVSDSYRPKYVRGVLHEATTKRIKTTTNVPGVGDGFENRLITRRFNFRGDVPDPEVTNSPFATSYCDIGPKDDRPVNAGMLPSSKDTTGNPILWTRKPFNPPTGAQSSIFKNLASDTGEERSYVQEVGSISNPFLGIPFVSNTNPVFANIMSDGRKLWSDKILPIGKSITRNTGGTSTVVSSKREYCTVGLNRTTGMPANESNGGGSPNIDIFPQSTVPVGGVIYDDSLSIPATYQTSRQFVQYTEDAQGSSSSYRGRTFAIFNHGVEMTIPKRINYVVRVYNDTGGLVSTSNVAVSLDSFYLQNTDKISAGTLLRRIDAGQTIKETKKGTNVLESTVAICKK